MHWRTEPATLEQRETVIRGWALLVHTRLWLASLNDFTDKVSESNLNPDESRGIRWAESLLCGLQLKTALKFTITGCRVKCAGLGFGKIPRLWREPHSLVCCLFLILLFNELP